MNETEYSYAVGRIRANELKLLSKADYEQLIGAADKNAVIRFLIDKGWQLPENAVPSSTERELEAVWRLFCESAPDASLLDALIIGNDFYNLKAAIKATFSDLPAESYFTYPSLCPGETVAQAIKTKQFDLLPPFLRGCAEKAYEAITALQSGQLAEIIIDKASLSARLEAAKKAKSGLLTEIIGVQCAQANIKVALRCAATGKSAQFALDAMCPCPYLDNGTLVACASDSGKIADYIETTPLAALADSLRKGFSAFEKKCGEYTLGLLEKSKWTVFGPDPLVSFWFTKVGEIRNVRLILSAKENGLSPEIIRERVRVADV